MGNRLISLPLARQCQESAQPGCSGHRGSIPRGGTVPAPVSQLDPAATPWLSAAVRGAAIYSDSISDSGQAASGRSAQVARRRHRKRGCRGHGALERRRQQRQQVIAAVIPGQRVGTRRSSPGQQHVDVMAAVQTQQQAIAAMAASVDKLAKAVSHFVYQQRHVRADSHAQSEAGVVTDGGLEPTIDPADTTVEFTTQQIGEKIWQWNEQHKQLVQHTQVLEGRYETLLGLWLEASVKENPDSEFAIKRRKPESPIRQVLRERRAAERSDRGRSR